MGQLARRVLHLKELFLDAGTAYIGNTIGILLVSKDVSIFISLTLLIPKQW